MKSYFTKLLSAIVVLSAVFILMPAKAITQGQNATQGRWLSVVGIVAAGRTPAVGYFCAGSLIAPRWAVTAAHCVNGLNVQQLEVVTGLYSLNQVAGTQRHAVNQIIVHPQFNTPELNADIALIRLTSASSRPVMPVFGQPSSLAARAATAIGWGFKQVGGSTSTILQQVSLPVVANTICEDAYAGVLVIQPSIICAGDGMGGPSICTRDSGAPLMVRIQDQDVLAGVASFSLGCGTSGHYSGFARISVLLSFLQQHVSELQIFTYPPGFYLPAILQLLLAG